VSHRPATEPTPRSVSVLSTPREADVTVHGSVKRLTIMLRETVQYHHRPLYTEIVHRAHKRGLAGATVVRGLEGFGGSQRIHTGRPLHLAEDTPVIVVIVDSAARISDFLADLEELPDSGLMILDEVEVYRYVRTQEHPRPTGLRWRRR
jgi:PII-like signaling protein